MGCTTLLLPMSHGLYNTVQPMGHGICISHGAWIVQCFSELSTSHDPWTAQCYYCPWVMDCTALYSPWAMENLFPMLHGLYSTSQDYIFPMAHGPYSTILIHGSWAVRCCTVHGPWRIYYPWVMGVRATLHPVLPGRFRIQHLSPNKLD